MDPDKCLLELIEAATCADQVELEEKAAALSKWIGRGGFAPDAQTLRAVLNANRLTMLQHPDGTD